MSRAIIFFAVFAILVAFALPPLSNALLEVEALPQDVEMSARSIVVGSAASPADDGFEIPSLGTIVTVAVVVGALAGIMFLAGRAGNVVAGVRALLLATLSSAVGTVVSPLVSQVMCPVVPTFYCEGGDNGPLLRKDP
jgi:hypothetical protein